MSRNCQISATADAETTNGNRKDSRKKPRSQRGIRASSRTASSSPRTTLIARIASAMYAVDPYTESSRWSWNSRTKLSNPMKVPLLSRFQS